ncbi:MAG TPA: LEA type 2 family protein [Thermoanaerobaculaceae bacterium]|nr:LEA type 2 family protein [Thermoanaerobaculaceae bacterium]HRS15187.1 LEA type 2 family protein [Thermoanaerobaculaceae bacterium]
MSTLAEAESSEAGRRQAGRERLDTVLRRCCWGLGVALAVLLAVACALWLGAHRWASRLVGSEVTDLRLERLPGESGALLARARLHVTNRTPFRLTLHGMHYRLEAGGTEIARGHWNPDRPLLVPARGSAAAELEARLDTGRLAGAALALLGGASNARLEGRVEAEWLLGRIVVPLAVERRLPGPTGER